MSTAIAIAIAAASPFLIAYVVYRFACSEFRREGHQGGEDVIERDANEFAEFLNGGGWP